MKVFSLFFIFYNYCKFWAQVQCLLVTFIRVFPKWNRNSIGNLIITEAWLWVNLKIPFFIDVSCCCCCGSIRSAFTVITNIFKLIHWKHVVLLIYDGDHLRKQSTLSNVPVFFSIQLKVLSHPRHHQLPKTVGISYLIFCVWERNSFGLILLRPVWWVTLLSMTWNPPCETCWFTVKCPEILYVNSWHGELFCDKLTEILHVNS